MGIPAGSLDRRIRLERAIVTTNSLNEQVSSWTTLSTVWAGKTDVSDAERVASAEIAATISTRFRIRWSSAVSDLNPKDRLRYPAADDGRIYQIVAVREMGRREGLEISAIARADK